VPHILIVDDEAVIRLSLSRLLTRHGHEVAVAGSVAEARALGPWDRFDLIVTDLRMPGEDGLAIVREASVPVVVITSFATVRSAVDAMKEGAVDYLPKPFDHDELLLMVERIAKQENQRRKSAAMAADVARCFPTRLMGNHPALGEAVRMGAKGLGAGLPILICGETGTGKELVARSIFEESPRRMGPFVAINCAAIPEALMESELFGHKRGAFTGADADRVGLVEEARAGVLFLDEIAELSLTAQARLLRVLQEHKVRRVGENEDRPVDFVLVAATHQNLEQRVAAGMFRADLLFRIQGIRLDVPPLRERGDDVMLLAGLFLQRACQRMARTVPEWSDETQELLRRYRWPGNVRELLHVVERAALIADGGWIHPPHLPPEIAGEGGAVGEPGEPLDIHDHFRATVLKYQGAMGETELAKKLGISRKTLWERRKKMGIPRS